MTRQIATLPPSELKNKKGRGSRCHGLLYRQPGRPGTSLTVLADVIHCTAVQGVGDVCHHTQILHCQLPGLFVLNRQAAVCGPACASGPQGQTCASGRSAEQCNTHKRDHPQHHPGGNHLAIGPRVHNPIGHHQQRRNNSRQQKGCGAARAIKSTDRTLECSGCIFGAHNARMFGGVINMGKGSHGVPFSTACGEIAGRCEDTRVYPLSIQIYMLNHWYSQY